MRDRKLSRRQTDWYRDDSGANFPVVFVIRAWNRFALLICDCHRGFWFQRDYFSITLPLGDHPYYHLVSVTNVLRRLVLVVKVAQCDCAKAA